MQQNSVPSAGQIRPSLIQKSAFSQRLELYRSLVLSSVIWNPRLFMAYLEQKLNKLHPVVFCPCQEWVEMLTWGRGGGLTHGFAYSDAVQHFWAELNDLLWLMCSSSRRPRWGWRGGNSGKGGEDWTSGTSRYPPAPQMMEEVKPKVTL